MTGNITINGKQITYDLERLQTDWELFETLCDLQSDPKNNTYKIVQFLRQILGDQEYENTKNILRDDNGIVPIERMTDLIQQILTSLNPNS